MKAICGRDGARREESVSSEQRGERGGGGERGVWAEATYILRPIDVVSFANQLEVARVAVESDDATRRLGSDKQVCPSCEAGYAGKREGQMSGTLVAV